MTREGDDVGRVSGAQGVEPRQYASEWSSNVAGRSRFVENLLDRQPDQSADSSSTLVSRSNRRS